MSGDLRFTHLFNMEYEILHPEIVLFNSKSNLSSIAPPRISKARRRRLRRAKKHSIAEMMKEAPPSSSEPPPVRDLSGLQVGFCPTCHRMLPPLNSEDGTEKSSSSARPSSKSSSAEDLLVLQAQPKDILPPLGGGYRLRPRRN